MGQTIAHQDFPIVRKITLSLFICAKLLLLISCSSIKLNATSARSRAKSLPVTASTPSSLSKTTLLSAHLITPTRVFKNPNYSVFGGLNQDYLFVTVGMGIEDSPGRIYRLDLRVRELNIRSQQGWDKISPTTAIVPVVATNMGWEDL